MAEIHLTRTAKIRSNVKHRKVKSTMELSKDELKKVMAWYEAQESWNDSDCKLYNRIKDFVGN